MRPVSRDDCVQIIIVVDISQRPKTRVNADGEAAARYETERPIFHALVNQHGHLVPARNAADDIQVAIAVQVAQSDQVGIESRCVVHSSTKDTAAVVEQHGDVTGSFVDCDDINVSVKVHVSHDHRVRCPTDAVVCRGTKGACSVVRKHRDGSTSIRHHQVNISIAVKVRGVRPLGLYARCVAGCSPETKIVGERLPPVVLRNLANLIVPCRKAGERIEALFGHGIDVAIVIQVDAGRCLNGHDRSGRPIDQFDGPVIQTRLVGIMHAIGVEIFELPPRDHSRDFVFVSAHIKLSDTIAVAVDWPVMVVQVE